MDTFNLSLNHAVNRLTLKRCKLYHVTEFMYEHEAHNFHSLIQFGTSINLEGTNIWSANILPERISNELEICSVNK